MCWRVLQTRNGRQVDCPDRHSSDEQESHPDDNSVSVALISNYFHNLEHEFPHSSLQAQGWFLACTQPMRDVVTK